MNTIVDFLTKVLGSADKGETSVGSASDIISIVLLSVVVLGFVWLVVAATRKKLSTPKGRIGEQKEDEEEAVRTARLWAEAKRKTDDQEPDEELTESEPDEPPVEGLQVEMLERARVRRDEKLDPTSVTTTKPETETDLQPEPSVEPVSKPALPSKTLEEGLKKTREGFVSRLSQMFSRASLEEDQMEEIEEILFTADIGVRTSQKLIAFLQNEVDHKDRTDPQKLLLALKDKMVGMLSLDSEPMKCDAYKPFVILVVGVNGTGKTTTIGKLALKYTQEKKKVILAAGDTFRAAAEEQLKIWGQRANAQVICGQHGADPASVIFDAVQKAKSQNADIVIVDTAGRLHTKTNLVEELRKVHRVCGKSMEGAPHEVVLVLDATTGQNAINQAKEFHRALKLTGIVLTKLDGTAKGGIILGISDTFGIPVRFIGIGEQVDDLREFDSKSFVRALFA